MISPQQFPKPDRNNCVPRTELRLSVYLAAEAFWHSEDACSSAKRAAIISESL